MHDADDLLTYTPNGFYRYINRHNIPIANALYPNQTHIALDTGHWVQAEKPHAFIDVVEKFLANNPESS